MIKSMATGAAENEYDMEFERRLLERIQSGEKEAFAELVRLVPGKGIYFGLRIFSTTARMPWRSCRRLS